MIPWLGSGQLIKGVLGKHGVEVTEVQQDMLFVIRRLGVLLESFHQPLGNHSSRMDVLCLGKESGYPDLVAFFEQFIWKVGFQVRRLVGCQLGFVFLISIFYEGWEGASPAGVYPFSILSPCISFRLLVGLTANTAAQETCGHFDRSSAEVDLQIVLV